MDWTILISVLAVCVTVCYCVEAICDAFGPNNDDTEEEDES